MKTKIALFAVCAVSSVAMADTVNATYTGIAGGSNAMQLRVEGGTYYAGHMKHTINSGNHSGEHFATFCIDFDEGANRNQTNNYQIVNVADAPMPGTPYGQAVADQISAVVANAVELGWIDRNLQADTNQQDYLGKMGAIQAAIWEAFGSNIEVGNSRTSNSLEHYYGVLTDNSTFDSELRLNGLRAMVADGQQDMLYVVPLPPAAFAGLGLLGGIAGVRTIRRRK